MVKINFVMSFASDHESQMANNQSDLIAMKYERVKNLLFFSQSLFLILLLLFFQFSGASSSLLSWLESLYGNRHLFLINTFFVTITFLTMSCIFFPFSIYCGFFLEKKYKLSNQSLMKWANDYLKSLILELIITVLLISFIYSILKAFPDWWWIISAGFYIFFSVVLALLTPNFIMPLFYKFDKIDNSCLANDIKNILSSANIEISGVYQWGLAEKTKKANAAFVGFGKTKRIILSDTLIDNYSREELLSVVAHEAGHCKNKDLLRLLFINSFFIFIGFYLANIFVLEILEKINISPLYNISGSPILMLGLFIFSFLTMPFINFFSRKREYEADAFSINLIGNSDSLISALEKLSDQNLSVKNPNKIIEFLMHSHPSLERRISNVTKNQ